MKIARLLGVGWTSLVLLACNGQEVKTGTPAKVETEEEKVLYALGLVIAQNTLEPFKGQFSDAEMAVILKGFADALKGGETIVPLQEFGPKINPMLQERLQKSSGPIRGRGQGLQGTGRPRRRCRADGFRPHLQRAEGRHRSLAQSH